MLPPREEAFKAIEDAHLLIDLLYSYAEGTEADSAILGGLELAGNMLIAAKGSEGAIETVGELNIVGSLPGLPRGSRKRKAVRR